MSEILRQLVIRGRVQGVGYRAWVEERAVGLGLQGWVRNRRDGSVEAVFAGPEAVVREMIESCRLGPNAARVDAVAENAASQDELGLRRSGERFSQLPTL